MNPKLKKIIIISGLAILIIIIGLLIYFLFFRPITEPVPIVTPIPPVVPPEFPPLEPAVPITLPPGLDLLPEMPPEMLIPPTPEIPGPLVSFEATGGITSFQTLESNPVKNPTLAANGRDLIYYEPQTGFFYSITPDGEKKFFSDTAFKNVETVTWSPNNQKAVLEYPDGSNIIYDFAKKASVTLPAHWKDFTFSNDSAQIAFKDMRMDPENRFISITDTNGGAYRQIERLGNQDENVHISWAPNDKYVALFIDSIDGSRSEVYPIGFYGENYRKFTVEGRDLRFEWSPSGDKLLYSVHNVRSDYKPTLWIVNTSPELLATGRNKLEINTWADKCTFASERTAYCAVPRQLEAGTGFRPDLASNVPDDFYKIDIVSGTKELMAQPLFSTTVNKMIISQDGKSLYWLDLNTGQINKMNL